MTAQPHIATPRRRRPPLGSEPAGAARARRSRATQRARACADPATTPERGGSGQPRSVRTCSPDCPNLYPGAPWARGHNGQRLDTVPSRDARPQRVLLGNLEPMVQLGMTRLLADGGVEVLAGEDGGTQALLTQVARLLPDAVVLGLEARAAARELADEVRAAAPGTKVVLWARDETEMQVLDPGSAAPRRIFDHVPDALLAELGPTSTGPGGAGHPDGGPA